jgi:predicted methyltransferase
MMRTLTALAAVSALALAACTPAEEGAQSGETAEAAEDTKLTEVLAHERRAEDTVRDEWRNPGETLAFFQMAPDQTVVEYAPGGGWYTRVLAPYVDGEGSYVAVSFAPEVAAPLGEGFVERVREFGETFSATQAEALGMPEESLPEELNGTVDRVLMIRMMHNLIRWGAAESELAALSAMMKPDGMLGVVQHRAKADAPQAYVDGNMGYLKEAELIEFIEANGFEFVESSEINANPNDTADYENGVWTLPPSFALEDQDRAKYEEIGESDRMTLLFRKAG